MSKDSDDYHKLAKDAGNKLRAYVLSYASGATAVFFLSLTGKDFQIITTTEKALLIGALVMFVATSVLCLYELHIDARRFFLVAKQLELPETERDWAKYNAYKKLRLRLLFTSYFTAILGTAAVLGFLISRIA